ncbi:MAG: hypothetical protein DMF56_16720 [Acidobacteria bacterium]|nr:MAG: hypothetical protein DMF56_16720 [Acidobacteriota bacterium]
MPEIAEDLRRDLGSVVIRSPYEIVIGGQSLPLPDPAVLYQRNPTLFATSPLYVHLQSEIYDRLYTRPAGRPTMGEDITPLLSAANHGRERWEHDWLFWQPDPAGGLWASREDRVYLAQPGQWAMPNGGGMPAHGSPISVFFAKELPHAQPGFYIVVGETPFDRFTEGRMLRVYFNIEERGAEDLVAAVSETLNAFLVPFRFKILNNRGCYTRADGSVIYCGRRYFGILSRLVPRIYERVKDSLREPVPLFTKRLLPGVGLAEDPGAGDSFGLSRSRLLTQAIWNAWTRGDQSVDGRLAELHALFGTAGLRIDKPYLNAGSADLYETEN